MGPDGEVASHTDSFRRFVQSVRINEKGEPPISWKVPDGWRKGKDVPLSYATFELGSGEKPLQLTVTPVTVSGPNAVLDNANRWRGQLGVGPITSAQLSEFSKTIQVDGIEATLIEMTGPGTARTGRP
jgi:hypothetical protein